MDATKHDFPTKKLFPEVGDGTGMLAAKYDVSSIQDGKSVDVQMDTIQENVHSK